MQVQEIRNACVKITYAGVTFLVDPWLKKKGADGTLAEVSDGNFVPGYEAQDNWAQPLEELPMSWMEVLEGVDAYIVTHLHFDHIDIEKSGEVGRVLDHGLPVFVQNEEDAEVFRQWNFADVRVLNSDSTIRGVRLMKVPGIHGTVQTAGESCGVLFRNKTEPTLYLAGDTVWYQGVKAVLQNYEPEVVIVNACAANMLGYGRLIMDDEDIWKIHDVAPQAKIIAVHMDNVAHLTLNRSNLKRRLEWYGILDSVAIPANGEVLEYNKRAVAPMGLASILALGNRWAHGYRKRTKRPGPHVESEEKTDIGGAIAALLLYLVGNNKK